jgi:putative transcriptional regulator
MAAMLPRAMVRWLILLMTGAALAAGLWSATLVGQARAGDIEPPPSFPSLTGPFLVAAPSLNDPNFKRTVVYLVHHGDTGAMGLVINRRMAHGPIGKLFEAFGLDPIIDSAGEIGLHFGGPVDMGSSMVLHRDDYHNPTTIDLADHLAVSSSDDVLRDLAEGHGPSRSLLILGYAGWAGDQLEEEIAEGSWYVVDADPGLLFDDDLETKWERAFARRGAAL